MNPREYHDDDLELTLGSPQPRRLDDLYKLPLNYPLEHFLQFPLPTLPPLPPTPIISVPGPGPVQAPTRAARVRRRDPAEGKSEITNPPYPWATTQRATVQSLDYLATNQILTINGDVQCKRCEFRFTIGYDLMAKFNQVAAYVNENKNSMHERAPSVWKNPVMPTCPSCGKENRCKPVIADKKRSINWLFLLLGQMLGCCTIGHLKYFCKHNKNHRTGAKDRLLYLTYLGLCKQLDPNGPFDV